MSSRPYQPVLPPPPMISSAGHALFVDFDGTLVPIVDRPDEVAADPDLVDLLGTLLNRFGLRLCLISGRSIEQLDAMIGPIAMAITLAGSHGAELRFEGALIQPARADGLDEAASELSVLAAAHPGTIVEEKSLGVALHYRMAPDLGPVVISLATMIAARHGLFVQHGKMMVELRGPGSDKGGAIASLMARPALADCIPVAIGDDLTDETAFATARAMGGFGILIGSDRQTAADYAIGSVADVRRWLWDVAEIRA